MVERGGEGREVSLEREVRETDRAREDTCAVKMRPCPKQRTGDTGGDRCDAEVGGWTLPCWASCSEREES